jgi:AcrR family transcriptional regulator
MAELTLRERSRQRRRAAIEQAALRLFAEQGYDATPLAQVAEAAEVAPRTVSLYFSSKLDLALAHSAAAAQRLAAAVDAREPGDTVLDVMHRWLQEELHDHREAIALHRAMMRSNPELRGAETEETLAAKARLALALADDLGRSPGDVEVALVSGAFEGIIARLMQLEPNDAARAVDDAVRILDGVMRTATSTTRRKGR